MIAKGQSADARAKRLALGRCPVHGVFMCPETMLLDAAEAWFFGYYEPETVFLVRCPRGDCDYLGLGSRYRRNCSSPDKVRSVCGTSI